MVVPGAFQKKLQVPCPVRTPEQAQNVHPWEPYPAIESGFESPVAALTGEAKGWSPRVGFEIGGCYYSAT
jgi:hypothetical protein